MPITLIKPVTQICAVAITLTITVHAQDASAINFQNPIPNEKQQSLSSDLAGHAQLASVKLSAEEKAQARKYTSDLKKIRRDMQRTTRKLKRARARLKNRR